MEDKIKSLEKEITDVYGERADCQRLIDRLEKENQDLIKRVSIGIPEAGIQINEQVNPRK